MDATRIIGDALILLVAVFTIYLSIIMIQRVNAVVQKGIYVMVFRYELLACASFFLLALDLRFGIFTMGEYDSGEGNRLAPSEHYYCSGCHTLVFLRKDYSGELYPHRGGSFKCTCVGASA